MGDIAQRLESTLLGTREIPRRLARSTARAVDHVAAGAVVRAAQAQADAYVADTRVRGGAFVARTAMTCAAELSAYEEALIRQAPLGERRYQHIADSFAMLAAREIADRLSTSSWRLRANRSILCTITRSVSEAGHHGSLKPGHLSREAAR